MTAANRKMTWASVALCLAVVFMGQFLRGRIPPLKMGTSAGFPPFETYESGAGSAIVGFDVELAKAIAQHAKRPLEIVDMPFEDLIPALEAGEVDMALVAMTITEERAARVDFSEPYYRARQVVLMREGDEEPTSQDALRGWRIGVQRGTTGHALALGLTDAELVEAVENAKQAVVDLLNSQVDVVLVDEQPAAAFRKTFPDVRIVDLGFRDEFYGVAVRKGNRALLDAINETLAAVKADGRYDWFIDRWMVQAE
jgi:arginine/lysine/histidine transporter system substrate-binding protein